MNTIRVNIVRRFLAPIFILFSIPLNTFAEDWTYAGESCFRSKVMTTNGIATCEIVKEVTSNALSNVWVRVKRVSLDEDAGCFLTLTNFDGSQSTSSYTALKNTTSPHSVGLNIPNQAGMNNGTAHIECHLNQYDEIVSVRVKQRN